MNFNTLLVNLTVKTIPIYMLKFLLCGWLMYYFINFTNNYGITPSITYHNPSIDQLKNNFNYTRSNHRSNRGEVNNEKYNYEIKKHQEYNLMRLHIL